MHYPDELTAKMHANSFNSIMSRQLVQGAVLGASSDSFGQMPQRDNSPVDVSTNRLFERLGQMQAELNILIERLAPVSRPEGTEAGDCKAGAPSACHLVSLLDQGSDRIESMINHIHNARDRLCI
jgi:hypothetical protein